MQNDGNPAAAASDSGPKPAVLGYNGCMNILVYCTVPDDDTAARLAHVLVDERLAACVSRIGALASTYRWQGEVRTEQEVLLLIKTRSERFDALEARVLELHPFDVPELIAVPIERGHQPYLDWLGTEVAASSSAGKRS